MSVLVRLFYSDCVVSDLFYYLFNVKKGNMSRGKLKSHI